MRLFIIALVCSIVGCASDSGGDGMSIVVDAMPDQPDAAMAVQPVCDEASRRAIFPGPFRCDNEPEFVEVVDRGRPFHIFKYEASHPLATAELAFPCATIQGERYEAPDEETEPCSVAGVRPWHSIDWADADAACEAIGWRLCESAELIRACEGPDGDAYTFGRTFVGGACNVRDAYRMDNAEFSSVAPTGAFERCVSAEGVYDLTGNLWEWSNEREESDRNTRYYHGAGWKLIAERHRDTDLVCTVDTRIPGFSARSFLKESVGFRCCRNVD